MFAAVEVEPSRRLVNSERVACGADHGNGLCFPGSATRAAPPLKHGGVLPYGDTGNRAKEFPMSVGYGPIIVIIAFLLLIAAMPTWPYARQWGYRPTMVLAIIFMMVAVFVAIGGFGPA